MEPEPLEMVCSSCQTLIGLRQPQEPAGRAAALCEECIAEVQEDAYVAGRPLHVMRDRDDEDDEEVPW